MNSPKRHRPRMPTVAPTTKPDNLWSDRPPSPATSPAPRSCLGRNRRSTAQPAAQPNIARPRLIDAPRKLISRKASTSDGWYRYGRISIERNTNTAKTGPTRTVAPAAATHPTARPGLCFRDWTNLRIRFMAALQAGCLRFPRPSRPGARSRTEASASGMPASFSPVAASPGKAFVAWQLAGF